MTPEEKIAVHVAALVGAVRAELRPEREETASPAWGAASYTNTARTIIVEQAPTDEQL